MRLIDRQMAIDTEGLDAQIRCEMCRNPMHTDRGCDGNCKYDEKLYERIMQILDERIKPLPSVQPTYTDDQIQKMQDMHQAEVEKAFELGREDAKAEIIRCKDCKYYKAYEYTGELACHYVIGGTVVRNLNDFCSRGEKT